MITLPTMWFGIAYISRITTFWDVEFRIDKTPRTSEQLHRHLLDLKQLAKRDGIQLLEFTVYDGEEEIWRGLV